MAFNPFDVFRRNQRILFAGLTVVIMLIFTLSFGKGDILSEIPRWFASGQRSGPVVATVDGSKLYQSQLSDTTIRRSLANQYLFNAALVARQNLRGAAETASLKATAATSAVVREILAAQNRGFVDQSIERQAQMAQFGMGSAPTRDQIAASRAGGIQTALAQLAAAAKTGTTEADQAAIAAMRRSIEVELRLGQGGGKRDSEHYFGNQPAATDRDAIDFRLWLRKADDLGIQFTDEDVQELAKKEFYQSLTKSDWAQAQSSTIARRPDLARDLLAALGDEFRVRAAQGAVLGQAYLQPDARLFEAPVDFYRFYRRETSTGTFGVVSIPAADFVSQVTSEPTDSQLRDVFKKGESEDPRPSSATIGLREPRRLKVAFTDITGDEPFFKTATEDAAKLVPTLTQIAGLLAGPRLALTHLPIAADASALTDAAYREYVKQQEQDAATYWFGGGFGIARVADTHLATPTTLAATIGMAGSSPLSAALTLTTGAIGADRQARLDTIAPALILPLAVPGSGLVAATMALAPQALAVRPLPKAAVQARLDSEARKKLATEVAVADVKKFIDEMSKLAAKPGDAAAKAKVADYVKSRGLTVKESQGFRDLYSAHDDPGLAALAAKSDEPQPFRPQLTPQQKKLAFGYALFSKADQQTGRPVPAREFFVPATLTGAPITLPTMLFWRTEEQPEERLRDFNLPATRAKLVAAWKRLEARKLAQAAADDLAAKAQTLGTTSVEIEQKLKDLMAKLQASLAGGPEPVRYFQIDNVASIVRQVGPGGQDSVGQFSLAATENIEYPESEMVRRLLDTKEKPPSSSVVMSDSPGDTFYVATLLYRVDPDAGQFATTVFSDSAAVSRLAGPVRNAHQTELRQQLRDEAVAVLKADYGYANEMEGLE